MPPKRGYLCKSCSGSTRGFQSSREGGMKCGLSSLPQQRGLPTVYFYLHFSIKKVPFWMHF